MIITNNDIIIAADGCWYFQGQQITNSGILAYFKSNLGRDKGGYYILNHFGERIEKGYLSAVLGFPLRVMQIDLTNDPGTGHWHLEFQTDYQKHDRRPLDHLHFFDDHTLALQLNADNHHPLYARLSGLAMASLAACLDFETNGAAGEMPCLVNPQTQDFLTSIALQSHEILVWNRS
ncbi:MAG: hypothetical protein KDK39_01030 [Leptospiraceae bacterium]|nr:hypothetical protein [Leptospiraceae bacterium]